jgi:sulfite exporter TauE/SafE
MDQELNILLLTAASLGFLHTISGPDHYLPFIVIGKARKWTIHKTVLVTFAAGVAHVSSSIVLGAIGIAMGLAVNRLEIFESNRGGFVAWLFIAFGLVYMIYGIWRARNNKPHIHPDGTLHRHNTDESVSDESMEKKFKLTPWVLITIFLLGPCEPLIPILMYPAASMSASGVIMVALVFGLVTILTMIGIVLLAIYGISFLPLGKLERYMHIIAGGTILISGIGIKFLGL